MGLNLPKRYLLYFTIAVYICSNSLLAQTKRTRNIDSMHVILKKARTDIEHLNAYIELAWMYRQVNSTLAQAYSDSVIIAATQENDFFSLWLGLNSKAEALRLTGNLEGAFKIHQKALEIAEHNKLIQKKAHSLNNIGLILKRQKNLVAAKDYISKAREVYKSINDTDGLITTSTNIGNCIMYEKKYHDAIPYYNEVISFAEPRNDFQAIGDAYTNSAHCYYYMNEKEKAKNYYYKGLKYREKTGVPSPLADSYYNYGYMLYEEGNIKSAKEYAYKALQLTKPTGDKDNLIDLYSFFSEMALNNNDYKNAYYFSDTMRLYKDSILNEANVQSLNEMAQKFDSEKKEILIENLGKEKILKDKENKQQKIILLVVSLAFVVSIGLGIYAYLQFKEKGRANKVISEQKNAIEEKQKEILDSINYAKRIQYTLLAHNDFLSSNLPEYFILFQPKDIVSGDFYWASKKGDKFYIAVCDSTGHGIPGAFMSLLNISFLNEAVNEKNIEQPNEILNFVRNRLIVNINKEEQKDGFDGILFCIDHKQKIISYSAANNCPVLIRNNELTELEYDKMPVGISDKTQSFSLHEIHLQPNDTVYLYTDGYADQFGGEKGKKFKYKNLNNLIHNNHHKKMTDQKTILEHEINIWKGDLEQVDDICVMGLRFD